MGQQASKTSIKNLPPTSLDSIINRIKSKEIKNIIVMCGAGISTSAGVPDFRSPNLGIYFKLKKYNLPYPEAIFESNYFNQNPKPFYHLIRELYPKKLIPTKTHKFLKVLENHNLLKRVYTQNIDALEHMVGVDKDKIIEAHGTFQTCACLKCGAKYDSVWWKSKLDEGGKISQDQVVKCDKCEDGVIKPDLVLFGDSLPNRYFANIKSDFQDCDLLIIMGTSLTVHPFADLINEGKSDMTRLLLNLTKPGKVSGIVGFLLSKNVDFSRKNDCVLLDYCDKSVERICDALGWGQELDNVEYDTLG